MADARRVITRWDQLHGLAAGTSVEVRGRYQPMAVEMRPPGEEPLTVGVILEGSARVLLGGYRTDESLRAAEERARLTGELVRAVGTYQPTGPYPHPGPPPAMWTGGGPQLVGVTLVEPIDR